MEKLDLVKMAQDVAKWYRNAVENSWDYEWTHHYSIKVAEAFLEQNKADDDIAVDIGWVDDTFTRDTDRFWELDPDDSLKLYIFVDSDNAVRIKSYGATLQTNPTRGELRMLCRAMGVDIGDK